MGQGMDAGSHGTGNEAGEDVVLSVEPVALARGDRGALAPTPAPWGSAERLARERRRIAAERMALRQDAARRAARYGD